MDEMCLAALIYYPKTSFSGCYSSPEFFNKMTALGGALEIYPENFGQFEPLEGEDRDQ
jgi:hypothetical protein